MTQAWFDSAKVKALYNKDEKPLNVWRGGTITEVSEEHQQTKMDKNGGKGELLFWDSPANTQPMMQVYVTVQTAERNHADPDDTGLRRIYIPKNGHAPGNMFTETGKALKEAGVRTGLEVGGEIYQMFVGTTPAKNKNFEDRNLWRVAYRPPANQFFVSEVPAMSASQANSNGQPAQQFVPAAQPTVGAIGYQPAPQPVAAQQQPWAQPAAQAQPVAATAQQPWEQPAAAQQPWEQPAAAQQAPQWPTAPPQSQPPTAAPSAQQPAAQGQQWPPGGQQAYQPPPVDPRHPFG